jgi:glycosyltransferase involved in cell wall biosynthesis
MPDIFYLSYRDDFSEENYERIWELADRLYERPRIELVSDIPGIYQAHNTCAKLSQTENFFVIDADAYLMPDFNLGYDPMKVVEDIYPGIPAAKCTHVWRAKNAATGMIYGYGGVKMFNVHAFEGNDDVVDMTTTVARRGFPYYAVQKVSNYTNFNTSPLKAWRGAFRECAKLASGDMEDDAESKIYPWLHPVENCKFRDYVIQGALTGSKFGTDNKHDRLAMKKINDWDWLEAFFTQVVQEAK